VVSSPEAAISWVCEHDEVMIIGGGNVYQQFLERADTLYLTFIDLDVKGDTQFPDYEKVANWKVIEEQYNQPSENNLHAYTFVTLDKIK